MSNQLPNILPIGIELIFAPVKSKARVGDRYKEDTEIDLMIGYNPRGVAEVQRIQWGHRRKL